jgi:hypothetical protein
MITQHLDVTREVSDRDAVAAYLRIIADKIEANELVACVVATCDVAGKSTATSCVNPCSGTVGDLCQIVALTHELLNMTLLGDTDKELLEMVSDASKPTRH